MNPVAETLEAITRPVRHGTNNLMMVLLGNLDLILRTAPDGSATARQAGRAKEAAERLGAMLGGYLALPRDPGLTPIKPMSALTALAPLLETIAGRAIRYDEEAVPAVLWPRPELPMALVQWAAEAARPDVVPVLRLAPLGAGAALILSPAPRASAIIFAAAAEACGGGWDDDAMLFLPQAP